MGEEIAGLSRIDAAKRSISAVKKLISDLELPIHFRELSVKEEDVPQIVENAIKTGIHLTSPRNISM